MKPKSYLIDYNKDKGRFRWIDNAKGIGIILIIVGHMNINDFVCAWIYSFHVPLFFFLSGTVFSPKSSFKEFLYRKIRGLIIPYFILGSPYFVLYFWTQITQYDLLSSIINTVIIFSVQIRYGTIWFLTCLFLLNIIFYFFIAKIKSKTGTFLLSFLLCVLGYIYYKVGGRALPWNLDVCMMATPFFAAGYYGSNILKKENNMDKRRRYFAVLILISISIICGVTFYAMSNVKFDMAEMTYPIFPLSYALAFLGIFAIIMVSQLFNCMYFEQIGRDSIFYLVWHKCLAIPLIGRCLEYIHLKQLCNSIGGSVIYVCIELILVLVFLKMASRLIYRMGWDRIAKKTVK